MKLDLIERLKSLQDEVRPFIVLKYIQRVVLMHPEKGKPFSRVQFMKHLVVVLACTFPIVVGIHMHIYQAFSDGLVQEAVGSLYYSSSVISYIMIGAAYNLFGNKLWLTINRIESDKFGRPQALQDECRRSNRITLMLASLVIVLEGSLSVYYYITDKFCESRVKTNDKRYRCGYDSAAWYPFEEDTFVKEWILKLWWNMGELIMLPVIVTTIFSFMEMLRFITIRMQDLKSKIESIDESNIQNSSENIKFAAMYYIEILECIEELNYSLGYSFIFTTICSTLVLSLVGYVVILGHQYTEFPVLMILYSGISILCYFGQTWEDEHDKLVKSVNNLPWHMMKPKMRRDYLLLLGTIQIPVHLIAHPHIPINNSLLLAVTKTTYSVLTFLMHSTE